MQRYKMMSVRAAAVIGGLALLGAGCNPLAPVQEKIGENIAEKKMEDLLGGKVNVDLSGKIPADFPSDIPKYPTAEYISAAVMQDGKVAVANFTTGDSPEDVVEWFDREMTSNGYELDRGVTTSGFRLYKKTNVAVTLQIQRTGQETKASIQRAEK